MKPSLPSSPKTPNPGKTGHRQTELKEEIRMLRSVMRRVINLAEGGQSLDELLRVLDTFSSAATRLAKLLKAEQQFARDAENVGEILNQALSEVIDALKKEE